jgi:predicted AAA+ superfamily ATPase
MLENERSTINPSEGVDETVSLSDRFGLWIGFHNCSQDDYLDMVRGYARYYRLPIADETLTREALAWALARRPLGPRRVSIHSGSGRTPRHAA